MASPGIIQFDNGIAAVDTEYGRPLADASHLIVESGRAAFVDTGVNDSVPLLLASLRELNLDVGDVDYVFLTHVHLDHAGGAGTLMQALPNARCIVHPRGAPHMIDPAKIIAGTEAVYGVEATQRQYGTIEPIAADRIVEAGDGAWVNLNGRALETIYTEGHARHHYVINDPASRGVFTGDSFGVSYRETDTPAGEFIFPTATPIDFDPDAAHLAYDRILACDPDYIFVTHYSRIGGSKESVAALARQLHDDVEVFRAIALDCAKAGDRQEAVEENLFEYLADRLEAHHFPGDREAMRALLATDIVLNAQGLVVWLDRRRKTR